MRQRLAGLMVDYEPLRQPAVVHATDTPPRESRKPVAFFPFPSAAAIRDSVGCDASARPSGAVTNPVAHSEAQRRVSALRPRVVVVPATLGREKERGAQQLRPRRRGRPHTPHPPTP